MTNARAIKPVLLLWAILLAALVAWFVIAHPYRHRYGSAFRGLGAVEVAKLIEEPSDYLKQEVRIEGTVTRQCPCCGCWFFVKDSLGRELRVEMGEIGEPIPFRPGKVATLEGQLIRYGEGYEFIGTAVEFH